MKSKFYVIKLTKISLILQCCETQTILGLNKVYLQLICTKLISVNIEFKGEWPSVNKVQYIKTSINPKDIIQTMIHSEFDIN